jgi:hypothetical protein
MKTSLIYFFRGFLAVLFFILSSLPVPGQTIDLPVVIGDNMVVQCDKAVKIWGKCGIQKEVTVSFAGQVKNTTSDATGNFHVLLDPMTANSTSRQMTISSDGQTKVLSNIVVGEVFLCSGQSNMQFAVSKLTTADKDLIAADSEYPNVRYYSVAKNYSSTNQGNTNVPDVPWTSFNYSTVQSLSAIAFYFSRQLYKDKDIPVGVIDCSQGSSTADAWISLEYYEQHPELIPYRYKFVSSGEYQYYLNPGVLYESMLSRVIPYTLRSFLWYQGESNATTYYNYYKIFEGVIDCFRESWGDENIPFIFAQLTAYESPSAFWPLTREVQDSIAKTITNTAMISTIDVGEQNDIHPKNKKVPGERFALAAKNLVYNDPVSYSGPNYQSIRIEGNKAIITFDKADGLHATSYKPEEFDVCGDNYVYLPATGFEIVGNELHVWSDAITYPIAVRYAWKNFPAPILFDSDNLPVNPFRTSRAAPLEIYVTHAGDDANTGTKQAPLKTISKAVSLLEDFSLTKIFLEKDAVFEEKGILIDKNKQVIITGENTTIIAAAEKQSQQADRIIFASTNTQVSIKGITFKNGYRFVGTDNPGNSGAAIFFQGESLDIDSCKFIDNVASVHGGAIANYGKEMFINHSYFEGSVSVAGYGGAVTNNGLNGQANTLKIYNSTFSKNTALSTVNNLGMGGAVHVHNPGTSSSFNVEVINCTFVENSCAKAYYAALDFGLGVNTTAYVLNNTFYKNTPSALKFDGATNKLYLANNAIAGGQYGIMASIKTESRLPVEGYNNVVYASSSAISGTYIQEACFTTDKVNYKNDVTTTSTLTSLYLNDVLVNEDTYVPYLPITSGSSILVNMGTDAASFSSGENKIPASDTRGLNKVGVRDIGAYEYEASGTSGIQDIVAVNKISVFPNPVINDLNISDNVEGSEIRVYDLISANPVLKCQFARSVSLAGFAPGVYILEIFNGGAVACRGKFIKKNN